MKLNNEQTDIKVFGASTTDARIEEENLGIITQILTSNLYSKPHESFMREIVSNAYDSEKQAGTLDMPIIIKIDYKDRSSKAYPYATSVGCTCDITIRDYGTGMDEDEFRRVFCSIGASTRRGTDEFIGAFGIGRFSALAVTDKVYVSAFQNGIVNRYIMGKSGNKITFVHYETEYTKEKNGLEYRVIDVKNTNGEMSDAVKAVALFPNVFIQGMHMDDIFNKRQIVHHQHYVICDQTKTSHRLAIGNVLYEVDKSQLDDRARTFCDLVSTGAVKVKIPIGSVCLTPNRETVIYTSETKAVLNKAFHDAENELRGNIKDAVDKDNDILDYLRVQCGNAIYDPITGQIAMSAHDIHIRVDPDDTFLYKGHSYAGKLNIIKTMMGATLPGTIGSKRDGRIVKDMWYSSIKKVEKSKSMKYGDSDAPKLRLVLVKGTSKLSAVLRKYIISHDLEDKYDMYMSYLIAFDMDRETFRKELWKEMETNMIQSLGGKDTLARDADTEFLVDELYDYIHANATILDTGSERFAAFKKAQKATEGKDDVMFQVEHITATTDSAYDSCVVRHEREKLCGNEWEYLHRKLRDKRGRFVINPPKGTEVILAQRKIDVYRMRKDVARLYMDIPQYDTSKDRKASRMRTIYDILSKEDKLEKDVVEKAIYLSARYNRFLKVFDDYLAVRHMSEYLESIKDVPVDTEAEKDAKELVRRIHIVMTFKELYGKMLGMSYDNIWLWANGVDNLLVMYIVKTKGFLVDHDAYERYKRDNLLRALRHKEPI